MYIESMSYGRRKKNGHVIYENDVKIEEEEEEENVLDAFQEE